MIIEQEFFAIWRTIINLAKYTPIQVASEIVSIAVDNHLKLFKGKGRRVRTKRGVQYK